MVIIEEEYEYDVWEETSSSSSIKESDTIDIELNLNEDNSSVDEGEMRLLKMVLFILVIGVILCRI